MKNLKTGVKLLIASLLGVIMLSACTAYVRPGYGGYYNGYYHHYYGYGYRYHYGPYYHGPYINGGYYHRGW